MHRLKFLERLHDLLEPSTYLEIGVRKGASLALSRARSVGIDPRPAIEVALPEDARIVTATSDDYFAGDDALAPFDGRPIDLALIDGMHLFEYALRDYMNIERHSAWWSVIVFDDVLPSDPSQTVRERMTPSWTGDVFKIISVLEQHRPELACLRVDVAPTGLLLVLGPDRSSTALSDRYDELLSENVAPDPQRVPNDVLTRARAVRPEQVLKAPFWPMLRDARAGDVARADGLPQLTGSLDAWAPAPARPPGPLRRELRRRVDFLQGWKRRRPSL